MILTWNISAEESNWRSGILEAWSNHWMGSMDSAPQHIEIPEHIVNANWWVLNNVLQSEPARDVAVAVAALVRALATYEHGAYATVDQLPNNRQSHAS